MKQKSLTKKKLQVISRSALLHINGGNIEEEEEYVIIYINGVPYRYRVNKKGEQISELIRIY